MSIKDIKYYSLDEIDKIKAQYYMIFGERSNGKSYAVKKRLLKEYFEEGYEFVICKRFEEDMKSKTCSTMFKDLEDYILEKYDSHIKFYQGRWMVYPQGTQGKMSECKIIGYALSISGSDRAKGSQFPNVKTILLEEFMSINSNYLIDEINLFINLVSTIFRSRLGCKVYMLGNAISKHSPYSTALNVKLHRMKKGEIIERTFKSDKGFKTKFVIQRTENVDVFDNKTNTDKEVYNIFGNSGVGSMITSGDFETGIYNLSVNGYTFSENLSKIAPGKYKLVNKNYKVNLFVRYEDYFFQAYIVNDNNQTLAFREISNIHKHQEGYIINNHEKINNLVNIKNIRRYDTLNNKYIDFLLDTIINCIYQNNTLFLSNEDGEDVYNAMRLGGLKI